MWYSSCFKDTLTQENHLFFERMKIFTFDTHRQLSTIIAPYKFMQCNSSEGCLFLLQKTCDIEC